MYAKLNNGAVEKYPYTIGNLRKDNPNTSFPKKPSDALLEDFGMFRVKKTDRPEYDHTKNISEGLPIQVLGEWTQVWNETDATAEEIAERTAQQAQNVRAERDRLIAETDWTVLQDNPFTDAQVAEWVIYRQALRDITDHANFPYLTEDDWPTKP